MNIYHFDAVNEKDNYNHLNSYWIEGDYGNTITKELVELFHSKGYFAHQTLDEMVSGWIEADDVSDETVDVYDWFS